MPANIVVAGTSGTEQQRVAMTQAAWLAKTISDHTVQNTPFLRWLKENRRTQRGGVGFDIQVPVKYWAADNPKMSGVADPLVSRSRKIPKGVTKTNWKCAMLFQAFSIDDMEKMVQGDATRILTAAQTYIELAGDQWSSDLMDMLWAAETVATSCGDAQTVASIRTLVNKGTAQGAFTYTLGTTPRPAQSSQDDSNGWVQATHGSYPAGGSGAVVVVGGINRAAADTGVQFSCPVWNPAGSGATFGRLVFNQMISAGSADSDRIDMVFLDPDLYDGAMGILQAQQQLTESRMASYGFEAFRWRGVEFLPEDRMPASAISGSAQALGICSKNLSFVSALEQPKVSSAEAMDAPVTDYRVVDPCQLIPKKLGRGLGVRHTAIVKPTS